MNKNNTHKMVVDSLSAEPGTQVEGHLSAGNLPDGTPIRIPIVLVNGTHPGKTLYIQAISDGNELNGIAVIHEILNHLTPENLY